MFKRTVFITITAALAMIVASCNTAAPAQMEEKIGVAVTILPQQEFVVRVGGDKVDVTVMVPPGASPHTYEVTPAQMVQLSKAMVYCKVGSPIEFELAWLDKLLAQNKDILVVDCSKGIDLIQSDDPDEPGMDPHIWTSPRNAKIMVQNICAGLSQADPQNRQYYENNRDLYLKNLDELDVEMGALLNGAGAQTFIVYHPAWGYFARDYGLQQLGIEQEGKEPKAAYMSRLINEARLQNIKVVFISPEFDSRNAEAIAREIGGRVVIIDPLAGDYLQNMREVAAAFKEALN
ncbi:MAG: zinc ABC transporter substrate-binding protein [Dehalococcoidia bacterium]|nr:zinc ABC transporter substrate-binding protein [Dehalococcoidia bacterium]